MKQRGGIARAFVTKPDVILMDEPFGALDAQTRNIMQMELTKILDKTDQTIIFITHSVEEAVFLSDRIVVIGSGTVTGIVDARTTTKEEVGLLMTKEVRKNA